MRVANRNIRFLERQVSGSGNPPQISSAFTSTTVIPFPGGNFANPDNPISEDTEYLPGLNERGETGRVVSAAADGNLRAFV